MTDLLQSRLDAERWLYDQFAVSRETLDRLALYARLVEEANGQQNLVAASTLGDRFWVRHLADSAQLLTYLPPASRTGLWIDLGSGPGLPGLIIALLVPEMTVHLVESRRLRCAFLHSAIESLGLDGRVSVIESRCETIPPKPYAVISARAFAPLPKLVQLAQRFADLSTIWLLPKGQNAVNELSTLPSAWQKVFHVEPSVTDATAGILVGHGRPG